MNFFALCFSSYGDQIQIHTKCGCRGLYWKERPHNQSQNKDCEYDICVQVLKKHPSHSCNRMYFSPSVFSTIHYECSSELVYLSIRVFSLGLVKPITLPSRARAPKEPNQIISSSFLSSSWYPAGLVSLTTAEYFR